MADPTADLLADLARRIQALETAPRAPYTTVRAGTMAFRGATAEHAAVVLFGAPDSLIAAQVIYSEDDVIRAYFGTLASGDVSLRLDNPDKSGTVFHWDSSQGLIGPYEVAAWQKNPTQPISSVGIAQTTSGSFEIGYRSIAYVTTDQLVLEYWVNLGGATSAEVNVTAVVHHNDRGAVPAAAQIALARTITATNSYSDVVSVPSTLWTPAANPVGSLIKLEFSARVASGAGTVQFAPILPGYFR